MERTIILSKKIEKILRLGSGLGTELPGLLVNFFFFSNLKAQYKDSKILDLLAQYLKLEVFALNQTVYTVNSVADKVYFILEGQFHIHKSVKVSKDANKVFINAKNEAVQINLPQMRRLTKRSIHFDFWTLVNDFSTVGIFESFGEEILTDCPFRQHTVVAKENCVVACLSYADYRRVMMSLKKNQYKEIKRFLKANSLFSNWSMQGLKKVIYHFKLQEFNKNQVVYKQGEVPESVYIIKKGEFLITQNVRILKEKPQFKVQDSGHILRLSNMRQKPCEKKLQIAIKGQNEILGLEEILNNISLREFTCTCFTDSAQVLQITKDYFTSKILNPDLTSSLKQAISSKSEWVNSRIEAIKSLQSPQNNLIPPDESCENLAEKLKKISKRTKSAASSEYQIKKEISPSTKNNFRLHSFERNRIKSPSRTVQIKHTYTPKKQPPANFLMAFREKKMTRKHSPDYTEVLNTFPY